MAISSFPVAPVRSDSTTFRPRAEAWVAHMPTFTAEANALAVEVQGNADDVAADKLLCDAAVSDAEAAQAAAESASSATAWVSGTTYAIGNVVWSPATLFSYRRKTAGAGTTDPSVDATNWLCLNVTGPNIQSFLTSGTWTKPAGKSADSRVLIEVWGGGGGGGCGAYGGGGGGGAYTMLYRQLSAMGNTEVVIVGAGGPVNAVYNSGPAGTGGVSSVGSLCRAGGGSGGQCGGSTGAGGAGGTQLAGGLPQIGSEGAAGYNGAGRFNGGGGASWSSTAIQRIGAPSVYGGGGGGSSNNSGNGVGGYSLQGGAGGDGNNGGGMAGSVPGGGGGGCGNAGTLYTTGCGASGKVIITVF